VSLFVKIHDLATQLGIQSVAIDGKLDDKGVPALVNRGTRVAHVTLVR
jgi:hypothetical protein